MDWQLPIVVIEDAVVKKLFKLNLSFVLFKCTYYMFKIYFMECVRKSAYMINERKACMYGIWMISTLNYSKQIKHGDAIGSDMHYFGSCKQK